VHDAEQGKEFKAQVLEYMPNGSLESWLYPKVNKYIWIEKIIEFGFPNSDSNGHSFLNWIIYTTDMCSLFFQEHVLSMCFMKRKMCAPHGPLWFETQQCPSWLWHHDMGARLADFGHAKLLQSFNYSCHHNSTSILGSRGSIGYIAPGDFFYFKEIFQYHDCFSYLLVFRSYISTLC
jgi:hypothetical protein